MQSQGRIEDSQAKLMTEFTKSQAFLEQSQERNISTASALQESQIRIENQLQQILRAQSRHSDSVLVGSLDASSPEGRQTWMELGRLLREEGITPSLVSKNRSLLIKTMKRTLEDVAASPDIASFKTAVEYLSFSSPAGQSLNASPAIMDSASMLSSGPSRGAAFPEHLNALSRQPASYLEHEENIEDGIRSLMGGMTESSDSAEMFQQLGNKMDLEFEE